MLDRMNRNEIAVVVHTCPARRKQLEPLKTSLAQSDICLSLIDWAEEPKGSSNFEKRLHYLSLLCRNARRAPYVLRLEDDIVVNRHIIHNLCTWPATRQPDFAVGLAFVNRLLYEPPQSGDMHRTESGLVYREPTSTPWAQAHLYDSSHLIRAAQRYFEELAEKCPDYYSEPHKVALAFDWAITRAVGRMGLRVYLHEPSLAQCTEVGDVRALGSVRVPMPHRSRDFDPEWRRDAQNAY
jgi:hypothetical protein